MKSTTDTANENFMTDQGSIRLRFRRARRGPRDAADDTAVRAARTASVTRAAPTAAPPEAEPPLPGVPGRVPLVPPVPGLPGAVPGLVAGPAPAFFTAPAAVAAAPAATSLATATAFFAFTTIGTVA